MCLSFERPGLCVLVCSFLALTIDVSGFSYMWGHTNRFAIPIFDIDLNITVKQPLPEGEKAFADVIYPNAGLVNDFLITSMSAFDESGELIPGVEAAILSGGVGFNYTTVRFYSTHTNVKFNFMVYGIPIKYMQYMSYTI